MKSLLQKKPKKLPNKIAYYNWQSALLLTLAVVSLTAVAVVWVIAKVEAHKSQPTTSVSVTPATLDNSSLYSHYISESLIDFGYQVPPIKFENTIQEIGEYEAEFKDKDFLKKNKDKWTIELMNVVNKNIITDFLAHRQDREKFVFFRYVDTNNNKRYILTYDLYPTMQMASGASKTLNFGLPSSVRVMPEQMSRYLDIIDDYQLSESVRDYSRSGVREVLLAKTNYVADVVSTATQPESEPNDVNTPSEKSIATSVDAKQTLAVDIQQTPLVTETMQSSKQQANLATNNLQKKADQTQQLARTETATVTDTTTSQPKPQTQPRTNEKPAIAKTAADNNNRDDNATKDNLTELIEQLQ